MGKIRGYEADGGGVEKKGKMFIDEGGAGALHWQVGLNGPG